MKNKKSVIEDAVEKMRAEGHDVEGKGGILALVIAQSKAVGDVLGTVGKCMDSLKKLININAMAIAVLYLLFIIHLLLEIAL